MNIAACLQTTLAAGQHCLKHIFRNTLLAIAVLLLFTACRSWPLARSAHQKAGCDKRSPSM